MTYNIRLFAKLVHRTYPQKNMNKIWWTGISLNPSIFELDYQGIAKRTAIFKEELLAEALHPRRISKLFDYIDGLDTDTYNNNYSIDSYI